MFERIDSLKDSMTHSNQQAFMDKWKHKDNWQNIMLLCFLLTSDIIESYIIKYRLYKKIEYNNKFG